MKYSIGDRVIVKESGEKAVVVEVVVFEVQEEVRIWNWDIFGCGWYKEYELLTDLPAIEKPFGLLSKEIQDELKAVNNGENIQLLESTGWVNCSPAFESIFTYRLDPNWKGEEVKEMTVGDVEMIMGCKVRIVKEGNNGNV